MATPSMAGTMLAREWRLEVQTAEETWVEVGGLRACTPITEGQEQDDTTNDAGGKGSRIVTGIDERIEASGFRQGGTIDGEWEEDPGQAFLREKGRKIGVANFIRARIFREDGSPEGYQATTTVNWTTSPASDPNALEEFSIVLFARGGFEDYTPTEDPEDP